MATSATTEPNPRAGRLPAAWGSVRRRAAIALLVLAGTVARAAAPCADTDVWVASSRRLPGTCRPPAHVGFDIERLAAANPRPWEPARVEDLLAEQNRPLVVFIHGNRYSAGEAKSQGVQLARLMAAVCPAAGPVRTVVFSWPSEQRGGLVRDARTKYDRAHADGHYLAALLARVAPHRDVALVGYSYGAIVGLQALRDLAGSDRDGAWAGRPGRTHVVLVVPAVRFDALAPRGPFRGSLAGVDRLTLVVNSADYALKFFHVIERDGGVTALGAAGMPRRWLPADLEYGAVDAADMLGGQHPLPPYLQCAPLARRIAAGALAGLEPPAAP